MQLFDLHLGRPLHRGALTVFPIWNGHAVTARGYDVHSDHVLVDERAGSAVVAELVLTNTGRRPALVLEGELLEGGQQHRVAARSMLVAPGTPQVLDVRCVEEGRWSGNSRHTRAGRRAPISVRAAQGQGETWERVHQFENRYAASATRSLLEATGDASQAAAQLVRDVQPLPYQTGALFCLAGQPLHLEAFDSPRTLAAVWDSLLNAAALDALHLQPIPTPGRRARRFLDHLSAVRVTGCDAGAAAGLEGHTAYARLNALVWRNRAVQTVAINPRHELVAG